MNKTSLLNNKWIFCHRGLWEIESGQNTPKAILKASQYGMASEVDFRISNNTVYIHHDPILDFKEYAFNNFNFIDSRLAVNIKSDGLHILIDNLVDFLESRKSFVFDGSIPEMMKYRKRGIPHALRISEYEKFLPWDVKYVWVDSFHDEWWINNGYIEELMESKELIFVSPELHGRPHHKAWDWLLEKRSQGNKNISICTDFPLNLLRNLS